MNPNAQAALILCGKQHFNECEKMKGKSHVKALVFETERYYFQLRPLANLLLSKSLPQKHEDILNLILVGLCELIYFQTATHASVNSSVDACEKLKKSWAKKLVNALLRRFLREKETLLASLLNNEEAKFLHPAWFIHAVKKNYPNHWAVILDANNQKPPLSLRVNQQKITRENYLLKLQEKDIQATPNKFVPDGVTVEMPLDAYLLPGFKKGLCSVQDTASQFIPGLLEPKPQERILDACAAPGGKTAHLLETEPKLEKCVALDKVKKRVDLLKSTLDRLALKAKTIQADATNPKSWWDGKLFDKILLDAPCSASGIIRRHPDIKRHRRLEDLQTLNQTQALLLNTLWPLLKTGGTLLYSTCSILKYENDHIVEAFLNTTPDAKLTTITLPVGQASSHGWQILPGEQNCDGFFFAKLAKITI